MTDDKPIKLEFPEKPVYFENSKWQCKTLTLKDRNGEDELCFFVHGFDLGPRGLRICKLLAMDNNMVIAILKSASYLYREGLGVRAYAAPNYYLAKIVWDKKGESLNNRWSTIKFYAEIRKPSYYFRTAIKMLTNYYRQHSGELINEKL